LDVARTFASVPLFDLIRPTARKIASDSKGKVGVLATASTARSQAFSKAIHNIDDSIEVMELGCPEFVPIVEGGQSNSEETRAVVSSYVEKMLHENVTTLVLGCTHFPFLLPAIKASLPVKANITIIDPAEILIESFSNETKFYVRENPATIFDASRNNFYVTGALSTFKRTAIACLGEQPGSVNALLLDELSGKLFEESLEPVLTPESEAESSQEKIGSSSLSPHLVPGVSQ